MATENTPRTLDRRSFLAGSALFAGALGLSARPAGATAAARPQQPAPNQEPQKPKPEPKPTEKPDPQDPFDEGEKPPSKDGKLYDKEGREYRICPQCGYNMYKQGKMWICENCGYSYVE